MSLIQKYNKLPKNIQYTIIGGSAIIIYLLYKKIFNKETTQEETAEKLLEKAKQESLANSQKLTYPASNYLSFANTIHESIRYAVGDNYGAVVDICKKMMNDKDVQELILAYGSRQLTFFAIPTGEPLDLFSAIKKELGDELLLFSFRVSSINDNWKNKGIKYQI